MSLSPSTLHDTFTTDLDSTYLDIPAAPSPFNPPATPANFASPQTSSSATDSMQSTPAMRPAFPANPNQDYLHQRPVQMNNNVGFSAPFGLVPIDESNPQMPPFFYPEQQMMRPHVPTQLRPQHPHQDRKMFYAGVHQQMHLAKQHPAPPQHGDAAKNAKVDAVLNQLKYPATLIKPASTPAVLPHVGRSKKEEDEMDEDERLLASEEGKKLSSKERRQLRNKVSARAFRSRRKEYISQLEAEVNNKNAENAALQTENERLRTENSRLESLSRMLLTSPAFSQFLDDLSSQRTPLPAPPQPPAKQPDQPWYQTWTPPTYAPPAEEPLLEMDEDYTVCDGFFATLRDEKADFTLPPASAPQEQFQQDQQLLDLINLPDDDGEKTPTASERKDLGALFPTVDVNGLLDKLEKVAGGEPVERYFDVGAARETQPPPAETQSQVPVTQAVGEGGFRRVGLVVQ